jgi:hypothetical protein
MRFSRSSIVFLLLAWTLVVLYPDPTVLVASARNVLRPQPDAAAAAGLAGRLPEAPREIEAEVLRRVPYATDWELAGVPWRFPAAGEAIAESRGDCEARALVLMSVLEARGIRYELRSSINHMWVDYPGKLPTANENDALVLADRAGGGLRLRLPEDFDLRRELDSKVALFWEPMPWERRILLTLGLLLIPLGATLAPTALADGHAAGRRTRLRRAVAPRSSARLAARRASSAGR